MRRIEWVAALLVLAALLAYEFVPLQMTIWDGEYKLLVHLDCLGTSPVSATFETFSRREQAENVILSKRPPESGWSSAVADPYDPVEVPVPISGRSSPLGRDLARGHFSYLLVVATFADGHRVSKIVDIPDDRKSREVTVTLP